ncbi:DUF3574 domain-containing protein [Candidatus Methylocalor cossyra]|uniref:DUF3574 domain-containing protein n=1 Tax=Candidatus Methylocalor cossyra TaxID=3108543 RepID=A0ABM9NJ62_9GAMM
MDSPARGYGPSLERLKAAVVAVCLGAVMGCASEPPVCRPGERASTVETLYFGAGGAPAVSAADWRDFLEREVTPRFPEGLTWWSARGQWRNQAGTVQGERSYVLQIVHANPAAAEPAIAALAQRYRERFRQLAVLRVRSASCAALLTSTPGQPP